ncbi:MAG: hypothetical protein JWO20_2705 [Candidatus Angelobacter sp.]|jgi:hypothetical protein|nr:hypothetical protein [Candidatus Angelobacter sp.]
MWNKVVVYLTFAILVSSGLGCNGTFLCVSSTPVPGVFSISPNPISAFDFQSGGFLIISGTNFVPASVVIVNGINHPTVFVNDGELRVSLLPVDIQPGDLNFAVSNPRTFGGGLFCGNGGVSGSVILLIND